jgi:hypothetical protein
VAVAAVGLINEQGERRGHEVDHLPTDLVVLRSSDHIDGTVSAVPADDLLEPAARRTAEVVPDAERFDISEAVAPGQRTRPVLSTRDVALSGDGASDQGFADLLPQQATVADDPFRTAFDVDAGTERLLDQVGAVIVGPGPGRAVIDATTYTVAPSTLGMPPITEPSSTVSFDVAIVGPEHAHGFGSNGELLLSPRQADELGWDVLRSTVVLRNPEPLTAAQVDAIEQQQLAAQAAQEQATDAAIAARVPGDVGGGPSVSVDYEGPGRYVGAAFIETVPTAVALLFALFVVAMGLALASAETREERDVLAVLGATPHTLRRTNACKAFLLTALGAVVAVPVGLGPVAVITRLGDDPAPLVVPWRTLALLLVAVPVLAALLTSTATRAALRFRPIRVSTATFE